MAESSENLGEPIGVPIRDLEDAAARVLNAPGGVLQHHTQPGWEWQMILMGCEEAIERYRQAIEERKALHARVAIGEALWWIPAADEF